MYIVVSSINTSILLEDCTVLRLALNMKFVVSFLLTKQEEISNFDKWILSIGDGDDNEDENC